MAIKIGNGLDLQHTQLFNAVIQVLSSFSGSTEGQIQYDSTVKSLGYYDGTSWRYMDAAKVPNGYIPIAKLSVNPLARANHTGTQTASTISDFDTQVRTNRLDQMAIPTSDVLMGGNRIKSLGAPVVNTDAATKKYVDDAVIQASAGIDPKESVRVATTANITLSGTQTIDGVALTAGDRVLVKNQSTASANGIYVVASGAWSRSVDADTGTLTSGALVFVIDGTVGAATQWYLSTSDPIVVGTTAQSWVQFAAGVSYSAGDGLDLVGSAFSVKPKSGGNIVVDATGVSVDTTKVVRKYATSIGDGTNVTYTVTHSLGTRDVTVGIFASASPYEMVLADVVANTTSAVKVTFAVAPTLNQYRVVVHG